MAGSRRRFAIALITAVLIGAICAAPASEENDINYGLEDPVTGRTDGVEDSNEGSAPVQNHDALTAGSPTENESENNSDEMEETVNSQPQAQSTTTTTSRASKQKLTTEKPLDSSAEESHSSTTEHPHNAIGRIYSKNQDSPGHITHAGGKLNYRIAQGEDENKRALEEYNYHFRRVELGLPPTTKRGNRFRAP